MQDIFKKKIGFKKNTRKPTLLISFTFTSLSLLSLCLPIFTTIPSSSLPSNYQAVSGNVNFQQSGNTLNVNSSSSKSIVNYGSFSVANGAVVNFNLPDSNSAILNRVTGLQASEIYGQINSNGKVFLVNPNGVLFGSSAQVNVGSLFASSLDTNDNDFLNGNYIFNRSLTGVGAKSVINQGQITTAQGGFVGLFGGAVQNTGNTTSPKGQIQLAVGDTIKVELSQGVEADVVITEALKQSVVDAQDAISNTGILSAEGGKIKLQASLEEAFYNSVVSNKGLIQANAIQNASDGSIELTGTTADDKGLVQNDGQLLSSGGNIQVVGDKVVFNGGSDLMSMQSRDGAIFSGGAIHIGSKVDVDDLSLRAGKGITQSASIRTANEMSILAKDSVDLTNADNNFWKISANLTGQGSSLKVVESSNIQVDGVNGIKGITTNNGDVSIDAVKSIYLWRQINADSGTVNLTAGNNIQQNAGIIKADTLNMTTKTGNATGAIDGAIFTGINNVSMNGSATSTFKVLNKTDKDLNILDSSADLIHVEVQGTGEINVEGNINANKQELWTAETSRLDANSVPVNAVSFTDGEFLKALEVEVTNQLNNGQTSGSMNGSSTNVNNTTLRQIIAEFKDNAKVRTWEEYKQAMESKGYKVDVEFTHQFETTLTDGRLANITVHGSAKEMYGNFRQQSLQADKQALDNRMRQQNDAVNWTNSIEKNEIARRNIWNEYTPQEKTTNNIEVANKREASIINRNQSERNWVLEQQRRQAEQAKQQQDYLNWWNSLTQEEQDKYNAEQQAKQKQDELARAEANAKWQAEEAARKQAEFEKYMNQYNLDWQAQFTPTPVEVPISETPVETSTSAQAPTSEITPPVIETPVVPPSPVAVPTPVIIEKTTQKETVNFIKQSSLPLSSSFVAPAELSSAPASVSAPTYYAEVPGLDSLIPTTLNSVDTVLHSVPGVPITQIGETKFIPQTPKDITKAQVAMPAYYYYPGLW